MEDEHKSNIRKHTIGEGVTVIGGGWYNGEVSISIQPCEHGKKIGQSMSGGGQIKDNSTVLIIKNEKGLRTLENVIRKTRKLLRQPYVGTFNVLVTEAVEGEWKLVEQTAPATEITDAH